MATHFKNLKFMDEHDWDGRCWPEEWAEIEGFQNGEMNARIEAFAAIRRAAEIARTYEAFAASEVYTASEERALKIRADAVRHAIRAAIGSEKQ
jgi:hypothetical protein